jgi:hypothetical protein
MKSDVHFIDNDDHVLLVARTWRAREALRALGDDGQIRQWWNRPVIGIVDPQLAIRLRYELERFDRLTVTTPARPARCR